MRNAVQNDIPHMTETEAVVAMHRAAQSFVAYFWYYRPTLEWRTRLTGTLLGFEMARRMFVRHKTKASPDTQIMKCAFWLWRGLALRNTDVDALFRSVGENGNLLRRGKGIGRNGIWGNRRRTGGDGPLLHGHGRVAVVWRRCRRRLGGATGRFG